MKQTDNCELFLWIRTGHLTGDRGYWTNMSCSYGFELVTHLGILESASCSYGFELVTRLGKRENWQVRVVLTDSN
ncbi:hypothetical protein MtrunA17_Chr7g0250971 [Medicago truncatula]|uniref:Uncharacterized protein n=1 Tax=Medicago truncatula TaxID=3880 RepID=A0A396H7U7_MEDTR|nr:hypothetical protein MtrunA17_Chr7g0250971 [Medicago truncatula]